MNRIITAIVALFICINLSAQENKLTSTGNAGIGTTNPLHRLSIETPDTAINNMVRMEHTGIPGSLLFMGTASATYPVILQRKANVLESYTDLHISTTNAGKLYFETGRTGAAVTYRMTLDNIGRLGINTTTPTTLLNVNGGAIRLNNPGGYPYGINIDVDFPSGWAREYSFTHSGTGKMFTLGALGAGNTLTYGYIGGNTTGDVASTAPWMVFKPDGNIGIGTINPGTYKLAVKGTIGAQKVKVTQQGWADFVFHPDYQLPSLYEIEKYIKANRHLPGIPTTAEVEQEGLDLGEMDSKLLQKIEEQTLYLIELSKKIDALQHKNALLQEQVNSLSNKLKK